MNDFVCRRFLLVRNWFPDQLINGKYHFNGDQNFKEYCTGNSCDDDIEKINAGCLLLFNELFGNYSLFSKHNSINIVDYIIIWLSYMLSLKANTRKDNLNYFYNISINSDKRYKNPITGIPGYNSYKDLVDQKKELMDISNEKMSKLYVLFKILCNMYTDFDERNPDCAKYIPNASEFVDKYQKLYGDSDSTDNSLYKQILSNLSTDYGNFKKKCKNSSSFPSIETTGNSVHTSEVISSSSSMSKNLFIVLSIFGAIAFFLGISYKSSKTKIKRKNKKYKEENESLIYDSNRLTISGIVIMIDIF
ncbi:hypothetical protein YYC_00273 [Plasmodium yoelii 17X]|uniref:Uncharacterized protein n=1 Tax=Plasmodium yoelii 17X TaxID=1323249 RepID=V7PVN8_PLAYE|nr:hypothetical protein YYC_00273 [Plasmodium yoelii 17X]